MKPVVLRLQAFTAYAGEQVIDFRKLGPHRLMMISGETGSGKTALLDAMAYALFGGSTGGSRDESGYRSDHSAEGVLTLVDFQFELQGQLYRAIRYPGQKGKSQGQYTLRRIAAIGDEEGEILATKKSVMSKQIEQLLGYNVHQFRSVVVLPQGKFRDFLAAETKDKAAILSGLFRTARYARLEAELKVRDKKLSDAQSDVHKQIRGILNRLEADNDDVLIEHIEVLKQQRSVVEQKIQQLEKATAVLAAKEKAARDLAHQFAELTRIREHIASLVAQRPERTLKDTALKQAQRAALIRPVEASRDQRAIDYQKQTGQLRQAQEDSIRTQSNLNDATERLQNAEQKKPEIDAAKITRQTLQGFRERVENLHSLQKLASEQSRKLEQTVQAVASVKTQREAAEERLKRLEAQREQQHILAAGLGSAQAEDDSFQSRLKLRHELATQQTALQRFSQILENAQSHHQRAVAEASAVNERFQDHYKRHLADYAAQLAGHLTDGEPCPVCGSETHPAKASPLDGAPDKAQVEALRTQRDVANQQSIDREKAVRSAEAERDKAQARMDITVENLGHWVSTSIQELKEQAATARTNLKTAKAATLSLPETQAAIAKEQDRLATLATTAEQVEQERLESELTLNGTRQRIEVQEQEIPDDLRSLSALQQRSKEVEANIQQMSAFLEQSQQQKNQAEAGLAAAQKAVENHQEALQSAEIKLEDAKTTLTRALSDGHFATIEAYREALISSDEQKELEEWIVQFDQDLNRLKGQEVQLAKAVANREHPDLEAVSAATIEAKQIEDEKRAEKTQIEREMSPKERGLADIRDLRNRHADREAQCQIMKSLYQTAQGNNTRRLSFERYVMTGLLDEVLIHASRRLQKMSGRYIMRRKDPFRADRVTTATLDKRSQAGLELEVIDSYTGRERDAKTLSGGEGFQASLSLALGLADVIQAQTGGIELSAMFIDEGFGTQSGEALDSVLNTLIELQDSGRLVGFISHVEGMRERIPAKLIVTKTPTGSTAKFQLS